MNLVKKFRRLENNDWQQIHTFLEADEVPDSYDLSSAELGGAEAWLPEIEADEFFETIPVGKQNKSKNFKFLKQDESDNAINWDEKFQPKAEITVNRFKWDQNIKIPAPKEDEVVNSVAWREKILAIAYNSSVSLQDIETKEEIFSISVESTVKFISWTEMSIGMDDLDILDESHKTFLSPLPANNNSTKKTYSNPEKFYTKNSMNVLLVACADGKIHVYIFGVLKCGTIDVAKDTGLPNLQLVNVKLSSNSKQLLVLISVDGKLDLLKYDNPDFHKYLAPLWKLSTSYVNIINILAHLEDTIQNIVEAWESVLLEMDKKLTKYAKEQPKGAVSADFLELLMFGYPSEALDRFLTHDLTEKELKKLGSSIELSYSTIQKLVVKPLHNSTVNLFYHINAINSGMAENKFSFKEVLGDVSKDATVNTGAFLIKSYELHQAIDKSMRDYKIFFRWLYIAISRLLDEAVPDDMGTINQQETNYLAEFLYNFEQYREESCDKEGLPETRFNLERVGQYFLDKNLTISSQDEGSFWEQLLNENECLKDHPMIYPHHKELSLIQQKNLMRKSIDELFDRLNHTVGSRFKLRKEKSLLGQQISHSLEEVITSHIVEIDQEIYLDMFSALISPEILLVIVCSENHPTKIYELNVNQSEGSCLATNLGELFLVDAKFYNARTLSILLKTRGDVKVSSCFLQLPIARLLDFSSDNIVRLNLCTVVDDSMLKVLDGFNGTKIAVSGLRKVSAILASNLKVIRLYDMEVEDDDEDEDNSNIFEG